MADPWADPVGGGWGSTTAAAPVGSPRKFSMTQSVDKLGVDSENVPLTALAGRSGRTPSKRMTMGGPTMVPYRGSPVTSPLVRRRRRPTNHHLCHDTSSVTECECATELYGLCLRKAGCAAE